MEVEVLTKVFHVLIVVYYAYVVELTCNYDIIDNYNVVHYKTLMQNRYLLVFLHSQFGFLTSKLDSLALVTLFHAKKTTPSKREGQRKDPYHDKQEV